jgi:membrane protein
MAAMPNRALDQDAASEQSPKEPTGWKLKLDQSVERLDEYQQNHRFIAIPLSVWRKFSDDDGVKLASLISYYAFLSIFPLLIVLATVLSRILVNHPESADKFVQSVAGSFLSIGSDESGSIQPLDVSGFALVIATLVALWSGLAVVNAIQDAANVVYEVPKTERPGLVPRTIRSIILLIVVGIGLPASTVLQGLAGKLLPGIFAAALGWVLVVAVNTCLLALAFSRATVAQTRWRSLIPGALLAAVAWSIIQEVGTGLLTSRVEGAEQTYGSFALVIGILFWLFLLAQITVYCCELNVVLEDRLWPRSLRSIMKREAETEADIEAYSQYPQREKQAHNIDVDVNMTQEDEDTEP